MIRATFRETRLTRPDGSPGPSAYVVRLDLPVRGSFERVVGSVEKAREVAATYDGIDPIGICLGFSWRRVDV